MTAELNGEARREERITRLYMDLTGASASMARNVYMHIFAEEDSIVNGKGAETIALPNHALDERRSTKSELNHPLRHTPAISSFDVTDPQPAGL